MRKRKEKKRYFELFLKENVKEEEVPSKLSIKSHQSKIK